VKYLSIISSGLSLNLRIYRSFQDFIAQSKDLSLKRISLPSCLVEAPLSQKRAMQRFSGMASIKRFLNGFVSATLLYERRNLFHASQLV